MAPSLVHANRDLEAIQANFTWFLIIVQNVRAIAAPIR
jgi:hypothetical protein